MTRHKSHREILLARRAALSATRAQNLKEESELLTEREPDFVDTGTERTAAGVLATLAEKEREELIRIEAALARIDGGTFGVCRECGEEIEPARLGALPEALRCIVCEKALQPAA